MQLKRGVQAVFSALCLLTNVWLCWTQSCLEAGYAGCCDQETDPDSCSGGPVVGVCYCDPSCHNFGDCCDDIREICHPERDELFSILKPQVAFTSEVSYQSASLHWVSIAYTNSTSSNTTELFYFLHLLPPSGPESSYGGVGVINRPAANSTSITEHYSLRLSGLEPGATYSFSLTAKTWFGEFDFGITESFTTLDPSTLCVRGVQLTVMESSSLQVSWLSLSLISGVTVTGHMIRYRELPHGHEEIHTINSSSTLYVVNSLKKGVSYSFVVMAIITEAGGRDITTGECTDSKVFVPVSQLLQLTMVGTFSIHCQHWEVEDEQALSAALRDIVVTRIRETLDSDYPANYVRNDYVICHSVPSDCRDDPYTSQRLTYRAAVLNTAEISANNLIGSLRIWSQSNNELIVSDQMLPPTPLTTNLMLVDTDCPVEVRTRSHPLCDASDTPTPAPVAEEGGCVSIPIFAASLTALFLFVLVIAMMIIVCILVCFQGKKPNYSVTDEDAHTANPSSPVLYNVYAPTPSNTITTATRTQNHTPTTPLVIRTTDSSSSETAGDEENNSGGGERSRGESREKDSLSSEPVTEFNSSVFTTNSAQVAGLTSTV